MSTCRSNRPELIDASSLNGIKVNEKVLLFPSNILKLVTGNVDLKQDHGRIDPILKITSVGNDATSFWYPLDDKNVILPYNWADENEISIDYPSGDHENWSAYIKNGLKSKPASFKIRYNNERVKEFKQNGRIEVVHPNDPSQICQAVIIRITPPLIWTQISEDQICVLPYNSVDMFPPGWAENHDYPLTQLLPHKKASSQCPDADRSESPESNPLPQIPTAISSARESCPTAWCQRIYFNHKCFTGP